MGGGSNKVLSNASDGLRAVLQGGYDWGMTKKLEQAKIIYMKYNFYDRALIPSRHFTKRRALYFRQTMNPYPSLVGPAQFMTIALMSCCLIDSKTFFFYFFKFK